MSKKEIHLVFQVLNFLYSDHHLAQITNATEHHVLINLASHKGQKGIFPSISTIAKELKLKNRAVIRAIQKWEQLEVLQIEKNVGKNNNYFMSIPCTTSVSTDTSVYRDTSVSTDTTPVSLETMTRVSGDTT
jgi:DNA-directed RNA polymerase specialized sigma subunit